MQYIDLKGFEQFVTDRNLVAEDRRPFYLRWVRRYLQSDLGADELLESDKLQLFSDQLAGDSSVKDCLSYGRCFHAESLASRGSCVRRCRRWRFIWMCIWKKTEVRGQSAAVRRGVARR